MRSWADEWMVKLSILKLEKKYNAMIKSWNYILTIKIRHNLNSLGYKQQTKELYS